MTTLSYDWPIPTISESNACEHWRKRHKRTVQQKKQVWAYLSEEQPMLTLPCHIHLIRLSPRYLDHDNLPGSFKHVIDAIADYIIPGLKPGRADGDSRLSWSYSQEKSKKKGIRVVFTLHT
jgi:hypothetical protein